MRLTNNAAPWPRYLFQFTHPVRGATILHTGGVETAVVSIHAPRAGCDPCLRGCVGGLEGFNSRTPCGVRHGGGVILLHISEFQFTHPVRGATLPDRLVGSAKSFQFTHPVRGATHIYPSVTINGVGFNSRTPCGVRHGPLPAQPYGELFQFTHPVRGATTLGSRPAYSAISVSIHAPRAGCDLHPHRARRARQTFQFTHPVRGATSGATTRQGAS